MLFPLAPLLNPSSENFNVAKGQNPAGIHWRHPLLQISVSYALEQLAFVRLAGGDDRLARHTGVEPQVGFALGRIRPMTLETVVGKNRPDIAIKQHNLPGNYRTSWEPPGKQKHGGAQQ